jgi:hypothetical protein
MACAKILNEWDWKSGEQTTINIGGGQIPLNYFSCGIYYFDGKYQVVKFPKGMQLYHGSAALANANVEYPAGIDFYKTHQMGTRSNVNKQELQNDATEQPNQSVAYEISKFIKVKPAWLGDPRTAKVYSLQNKHFSQICGEKCVNAYQLKQDAVFLILDNNFNIWRMLNNPNIPDQQKKQLRMMFSLENMLYADHADYEFGNIIIKNKKRRSYREFDLPFADWLCNYIPKEYAGYAANNAVEQKQTFFHLEFMFCNPFKWLKRDLSNKLDWQHKDMQGAPVEINNLLDQMALYKSTNVDFHAGNLLEHSIWSLLFAEQLVLNTPKYGIPDIETQRKIAAIAFIHDIGKMAPNNPRVTKRKHDCIYFSIPEHPIIGGDYIRGTQELPLLDNDMNRIGSFNIYGLLNELGFKQEDLPIVAKIIDLHWEFGNYLHKWQGFDDLKTVDDYIQHVGGLQETSFTYFYSLVNVSIADVLASQPYGVNNLTAELNHHSRFFPFISNVPKKYRGGNLADVTAEKRNAFAEKILDRVVEKLGLTLRK